MQYFEESLNPQQFVRVHCSYIVQLVQITRVELAGKDTHIAFLKSGAKIPLRRSEYAKLKKCWALPVEQVQAMWYFNGVMKIGAFLNIYIKVSSILKHYVA